MDLRPLTLRRLDRVAGSRGGKSILMKTTPCKVVFEGCIGPSDVVDSIPSCGFREEPRREV